MDAIPTTEPIIKIPSKTILERYNTDPLLTLLSALGAMRMDWSQTKLSKIIKLSHKTIKNHLHVFGVDWDTLAPFHKPSVERQNFNQELLKYFFYDSQDRLKTPEQICGQFPEDILTLLFLYLRDRHLSAENAQLVEQFKRRLDALPTSIELKNIMEIAINEFETKRTPSWFKEIVSVLEKIEAGKLKSIGDQPDGSRIIQLHISKPNVELLDSKDVDIYRFVDYAFKQYRRSLKNPKN